jgi:hypothetical protein
VTWSIAIVTAICIGTAELWLVPVALAADADPAALIDRLVSQNPKPLTGDEDPKIGPRYRTPNGFDAAKQQSVYDARAELVRLGPAAFPFLIARWSDERYCLTTENGLSGYCHNSSVGDECRTIIFDQLQPYGYWQLGVGDPRGQRMRPSYPDTFFDSAEDAKAWWEKHKDKSLLEMQVMVVEWIIAQEAESPAEFTDSERKFLKKFRKQRIRTQKPKEGGNFYAEEREFRIRSSNGTATSK